MNKEKKKKIRIVPIVVAIIGIAALIGLIILLSSYNVEKVNEAFFNQNDPMYANANLLTDNQKKLLEKEYEAKGYEVIWDEAGYMALGQWNSLHDIYTLLYFAKIWPSIYSEYNLIPCPLIYESATGVCTYIKGVRMDVMEAAIRYIITVDMTYEQAEIYAQYLKDIGYVNNVTTTSAFVIYDYMYSATNENGDLATVFYRCDTTKDLDLGYILIEIFSDEAKELHSQ